MAVFENKRGLEQCGRSFGGTALYKLRKIGHPVRLQAWTRFSIDFWCLSQGQIHRVRCIKRSCGFLSKVCYLLCHAERAKQAESNKKAAE